MIQRHFRNLLEAQWSQNNFMCVGLDSDLAKIPDCIRTKYKSTHKMIDAFNKAIVDATKDLVCAYKPNSAFYESLGDGGMRVLRETIEYIHLVAPEVVVIDDAKRGDIGKTNEHYAKATFDYLQADAITVNPYPGAEALKPFLDRVEKGVIVLCRPSNPGAGEFQDLIVDREPLYCHVARFVSYAWNAHGNCSLVVGATYPDELRKVRGIISDIPILIPGIGTQGGDLKETVQAGKNSRGQGMIINASSSIIFASSGKDFADAARQETLNLHGLINAYL